MSREGLTVERGISTGRTALGHNALMPVSQVRRILSQYVNSEQQELFHRRSLIYEDSDITFRFG